MAQIRCTVTTPEKTELDVAAESVTLPMFDGQMGILPGHSPMVGRLGYGLMKVTAGGQTNVYFVDGGFAQVTRDGVAVLTDRLQAPNQIKSDQADEELRNALALPSNQPALAAIKEKALNRARSRKQLASKA